MLFWWPIKGFKETMNVKNRQRQSHPRTAEPLTSSKPRGRSWEEIRSCERDECVHRNHINRSPHTKTLIHILTNAKRNCCYLQDLCQNKNTKFQVFPERIWTDTLPYIVFSGDKKYDVQQHFNDQNDRIYSWIGDSEHGTVARRQAVASVMVWAAVNGTGKSLLVFVVAGFKLMIFLNHRSCFGLKNYKNRPGKFQQYSALSHEAKATKSGEQHMFLTSHQMKNGLHHSQIWILLTTASGGFCYTSPQFRVSEGKILERMGQNLSKNYPCLIRASYCRRRFHWTDSVSNKFIVI